MSLGFVVPAMCGKNSQEGYCQEGSTRVYAIDQYSKRVAVDFVGLIAPLSEAGY